MTKETKSVFETLSAINVNDKVEKKSGLTYLSWAWAWAEVKKSYPDATYLVVRDPNTFLPYFHDAALGYMVMTQVTIQGQTLEMWLPVMDGANKAMKHEAYTYSTRYGDKSVEQASMFDINKTLMRCLVKNLAMFGLGHYIFAGEDLPSEDVVVDVSHWLATIVNAVDMQDLQTVYGMAYNACKRDQSALTEIIAAKDARKAQLLGGDNGTDK